MKETERRGIAIPLKESSWRLLVKAMVYLMEKPHLDDLEESREELGRILRYIEKKLDQN